MRIFGVTFFYAVAAIGGLTHAVVGSTVTLVWAPSGIALAAMLAFGSRMAIGVALGAFLANAWTGIPLFAAACIATGNTLAALTGTFLLLRVAHFRGALDRSRDVLALTVLAAMISTLISALVGALTLASSGLVPFNEAATVGMKWWLGDMLGVLVVTPPLLVWLSRSRPVLSPLKVAEVLSMVAALVVVSYEIFGAPELAVHGYYPASLAVFPFIIWGALRFGLWGASLVTLIVSIVAIWGTTHGTGPFVVGQQVENLVRWCEFAIVVAITGLLLAASVAERRRAQGDLKKSHDELELRVNERTRELTRSNLDLRREMTERRSLEAQLIRVSEEQQQTIGRELHDGLGQHLTSLALFGATLTHQLAERAQPEAQAARHIVDLANQASTMTQSIARGLYPAELEVGGLSAALAQLAQHNRSLPTMDCVFHADQNMQVRDPLVAINLYRIAQEAISNAVKYSRASLLRIDLSRVIGATRLSISDDGIGIDLSQTRLGHVGMHSMRYRASLLGGTFEILSNSPSGTRIVVLSPDRGV